MNRKTARDFVILGILFWLFYRRQETQTDVILRDASGNPIFPYPVPDYPPQPLPPAPIPDTLTYGELYPDYVAAPGSIDVTNWNVPVNYSVDGEPAGRFWDYSWQTL